MKLSILRIWHGERNRGTLPIEMSKIQRPEKENDKRHRKKKTKHRETTRSTTNNKAHGRAYIKSTKRLEL